MTASTDVGTPLLLMTPGPTRVPDRVLQAGARPMIHHRTPEFSRELSEMIDLMRPFFGTQQPVLPIHTTGRGALEGAICNLFSPGDAVIACCNGKFGEMWAHFAESYGLVVHRVATDWERNVDPAEVGALLAEDDSIRAVALTYGDTSTGVANDVAGVAAVARRRHSYHTGVCRHRRFDHRVVAGRGALVDLVHSATGRSQYPLLL
ncbi:MAG: aminotransferase class V-fold PLP-dependent enzyme [Gemmatimonadetes bacterium]|nr:aminotransferase class V-fold PLP-dependent enzyme [Gemmatimonadota bacterium]